jgi:hypothetical protein
MGLDASSIMVSFVVGLVGFAVFVYGKKQSRLPHMIVGMAAMLYPYFVSSAALSIGIAVVLFALLWGAVRLGA